MSQAQQPPSPNPSPPSPEIQMAQIQAMESSTRLAEMSRLRQKMLTTGSLTDEECRYGIRLIAAERTMRAGARGGSAAKAAETKKSFVSARLEDL